MKTQWEQLKGSCLVWDIFWSFNKNTWGSFICFFEKLEYSKIWKRRLPIFQKFRKALFQFRILLTKVRKTIFRCLIFLGKVRIAIDEFSSIANAMRTFPPKYKHLNIVLRTFQSRIRNWKRAFRKFGKFEERSSKFLEIRKLELISNE